MQIFSIGLMLILFDLTDVPINLMVFSIAINGIFICIDTYFVLMKSSPNSTLSRKYTMISDNLASKLSAAYTYVVRLKFVRFYGLLPSLIVEMDKTV